MSRVNVKLKMATTLPRLKLVTLTFKNASDALSMPEYRASIYYNENNTKASEKINKTSVKSKFKFRHMMKT